MYYLLWRILERNLRWNRLLTYIRFTFGFVEQSDSTNDIMCCNTNASCIKPYVGHFIVRIKSDFYRNLIVRWINNFFFFYFHDVFFLFRNVPRWWWYDDPFQILMLHVESNDQPPMRIHNINLIDSVFCCCFFLVFFYHSISDQWKHPHIF